MELWGHKTFFLAPLQDRDPRFVLDMQVSRIRILESDAGDDLGEAGRPSDLEETCCAWQAARRRSAGL